MRSRLGGHFRQNVVAYLALFVALGGTAVAAAPLITGARIQNGTINSDDLRNRGSDNWPGPSVQGIDVEGNTLTGTEILEASLAKVPNADSVDGLDSTAFGAPTDVHVARGPEAHATLSSTPVELAALPVPAGDYIVLVKVELSNRSSSEQLAACAVAGVDASETRRIPPSSGAQILLLGVEAIGPATTLRLQCDGEGAVVIQNDAMLLAQRLDGIN